MNKSILTCLFCYLLLACGDQSSSEEGDTVAAREAPSDAAESIAATGIEDTFKLTEHLGIDPIEQQRKGDLDVMEKARLIRVLTVYGPGRYYLDGAQEKGPTYELFQMFEKFINKRLGKGHLKVHVIFIPVSRDELIPALVEGRGDIAAAGLTITKKRDQKVDFTIPVSKNISEILVTGPSAPAIESIDDLSGQNMFVRLSSSYRTSLDKLNQQFEQQGKKPIRLQHASEQLEDEDILEMVNAGLIDWAVVDDYKAHIWEKIFENIVVRDDIVFRKEGRIAYG